MKHINEYLSTKVNDVNDEFPIAPMLDDIINFFRKNNFEEISPKQNSSLSIYDFHKLAEDGKKVYGIYDNNQGQYVIYFCFSGKITFENPLFIICIRDNKYEWIAKDYFVNNNKESHTTYTYNKDGNDFDTFFKEVNNKL